jgi:hypothetical protein
MNIFYYLNFETLSTWSGRFLHFISSRNRIARLYPQALGLSCTVYTLGFFQSRIVTAYYALSNVAPLTTAV